MRNVSTVEVAARAAAPPGKTEGGQTQKGDNGFKNCLKACSQEKEPAPEAEAPVEEAVIQAAEAAAFLLQMTGVQVEAAPAPTPEAPVEPAMVAPVGSKPVETQLPAQAKAEAGPETSAPVKAEAKVEAAAPVVVEAPVPVKVEAKAETAAMKTVVNTAAEAPRVEAPAPVPVKAEPAPVAQVQVIAAAEPAVEAEPVVKVQSPQVVETEPAALTPENVTAKISVDLTSAAADIRPAQLSQRVGAEIAAAAASGKSSLHIQIQPENMGRIDVRLTSNSDGMQVVLTTDTQATGKLLENNLSQLQKSLSEAGLTVSGLSVNSQGLQGQFTSNFQEEKPAPSRRFVNRTTAAAMPVDAVASRYSNQLTGLDYRV